MNITQCSQSKTAFQTVTSEGARYHIITTFGFVTDIYIHIDILHSCLYILGLIGYKNLA